MKNVIGILLLSIVVLVGINIVLWQKGQIGKFEQNSIDTEDTENIKMVSVMKGNNIQEKIISNKTAPTSKPTGVKKSIEYMSGWQVYRNSELGFKIKLPNDWRYIHRGAQGAMFGPKEIKEDTILTIIVLDEMPNVGDRTSNTMIMRIEDLTFAYLPAKRIYIKNLRLGLESARIVVQKDDKIISIGEATLNNTDYPFNQSYNQVVNKMLATFRFSE